MLFSLRLPCTTAQAILAEILPQRKFPLNLSIARNITVYLPCHPLSYLLTPWLPVILEKKGEEGGREDPRWCMVVGQLRMAAGEPSAGGSGLTIYGLGIRVGERHSLGRRQHQIWIPVVGDAEDDRRQGRTK